MKFTEKSVQLGFVILLILGLFLGIKNFDPGKYKDFFSNLSTQITLPSFVPTPTPTPIPTPKPYVYHEPTQDQKNYILALGAILSRYNNESMVTLKSSLNMAGIKPMMKESWNTYNHESAIETLDWLKMEGHRSEFNSVYEVLVLGNITTCKELQDSDPNLCKDQDLKDIHDIAIKVHEGVGDKSLLAWDYGRIINVARFAYSLGYISQEEAWTYMVPAAMTLQKSYSSWEEYGTHYILGRAYWLRDINGNKTQESILKYLLTPANKSPWTTLNWNTNLD